MTQGNDEHDSDGMREARACIDRMQRETKVLLDKISDVETLIDRLRRLYTHRRRPSAN